MASNPITGSASGSAQIKPKEKAKSKAKASSTDKNPLSSILKTLECPKCTEIYNPPIYICSMGHNVCTDCNNRQPSKFCTICFDQITTQRNFTLEEIVEKCTSKCSNARLGCKFSSTDEKIKLHIRKCTFKSTNCPFGVVLNRCQWSGMLEELGKHFESLHPNNIKLKSGIEIKFTNFNVILADNDLQLVTFGKSGYFLYYVDINPAKNTASWIMQKIGPDTGVIFDYEFHLYKNKKSMKIVEECVPSTAILKSIIDSGNCIGIPLNVLKNYVSDNKELTFKISIKARV